MVLNFDETIGGKLSSNIPKELWLALEQYIPSAIEKAERLGESFYEGHRSTAIGLNRHLLLNEGFARAMCDAGIPHTQVRGNSIVCGRIGVVNIARIHMPHIKWDNSRRSKSKVTLCAPNVTAKRLRTGDLFDPSLYTPQMELTVFVVTECGGGWFRTHVVVPDEKMDLKSPLFREELNVFLQRYQPVRDVIDIAKPKLKASVRKTSGSDTNSDDSTDQ